MVRLPAPAKVNSPSPGVAFILVLHVPSVAQCYPMPRMHIHTALSWSYLFLSWLMS